MKKLLLSAAVAAVIATPALAQSFNPDYGTGNVNPPVASEQLREHGSSAFAYAPRYATRFRHDARGARSYQQDQNIDARQPRDEDY